MYSLILLLFFFFCLIVHLIRFFLSLQTWMRSIRLQVQEIHLNWQITEVNFNCRDKLLRYWAISPQLITTTRASFQKANLKEKPLFISRYWSIFSVMCIWAVGMRITLQIVWRQNYRLKEMADLYVSKLTWVCTFLSSAQLAKGTEKLDSSFSHATTRNTRAQLQSLSEINTRSVDGVSRGGNMNKF